jgi:hypothetical protein
VVEEDQLPLVLVNHVRQPQKALPTLVSYPWSYAFRNWELGLVFDTSTKKLEEPCANERKCCRVV